MGGISQNTLKLDSFSTRKVTKQAEFNIIWDILYVIWYKNLPKYMAIWDKNLPNYKAKGGEY